MGEILVLAEHRKGALRDISWELLAKGREISDSEGMDLSAIVLGSGCSGLADGLAHHADRVIILDHPDLAKFNAEAYRRVLATVIAERKPRLTLIGHTSCGVDLAPALAIESGLPLATDCLDLRLDGGSLVVTRQVYGGKLNVEGVLREAEGHIVTLRPATSEPGEPRAEPG